jgi:hypothetical protein
VGTTGGFRLGVQGYAFLNLFSFDECSSDSSIASFSIAAKQAFGQAEGEPHLL